MAFELFNLNEEREINRMFTELEKPENLYAITDNQKPAIRKVARECGIRASIITMRDNRYKVSIKKS
jgi:hypothetical protein